MSTYCDQTKFGLHRGRETSSIARLVIGWSYLPLFVKITLCTMFCSTLLVVGASSMAQTGAIRPIIEPPQEYLPGSPFPGSPENIACDNYPTNQLTGMSCLVHISDFDVYFYYGQDSNSIFRTIIPAKEYAIGELILAWGTPTGFDRYGDGIVVSWGTRSANFNAQSFQPTNQIGFITYDLTPFKRSPWRGFGRRST